MGSTPVTWYFLVPSFQNGSTELQNKSDNAYNLPTNDTGTFAIKCSAKYGNNTVKESQVITVEISDNYIARPKLTASGTQLLASSRLVLTCDAVAADSITWKMNNTPIFHQYDHILQFEGLSSSSAFVCIATKMNFYVESHELNIILVDKLVQPSIREMENVSHFGENGNYRLQCYTPSRTTGMNYSWKKFQVIYAKGSFPRNNVTDPATSAEVYEIKGASKSKHTGNYTCTALFNTKVSPESSAYSVIIEAAGKPCTSTTSKGDCSGKGYKGTCTHERCDCDTGYLQKGTECAASLAKTVVASLLLILATTVITQLV